MTAPSVVPLWRRAAARLARLVSWVNPVWFVIVVAAAIVLLAVTGTLERYFFPAWEWADLDSEEAVPKWMAGGLLWTAAGCWLLVAATGRARTRAAWWWGLALAWLALDEGLWIHERLERSSGVDWQLLYLPVIAAAGLLGLLVLLAHRDQHPVFRAMLAGGGAWAAALVLELIQNWGGPPIDWTWYSPMMIAEETIEMAGSMLIVMAALLVLRAPEPGT